MAKEVQLFVSAGEVTPALGQVLAHAIRALYGDTPFALVSACTQGSLAVARLVYDSFHPAFTVTDLWNPSLGHQSLPPADLEQLQQFANVSLHSLTLNTEPATHQLYLMQAAQSLFTHNTIVCTSPEEVSTVLQIYHLACRPSPFFLAVERLGSVRRRVIVDCASAEELGQWLQQGGWQVERPFLSQLAQQTTLSVQQAFLSLLPANAAQMSDVTESITRELTVISQQVVALYEKLQQKRQELAARAVKINIEADQVAVQIEQLVAKQDQMRLHLADELNQSSTDLSSALLSLKTLESSPYLSRSQAVPPVSKRFPFNTMVITAYPTKILAKVQCFKHYQSSVYLSITSQGQTYKEDIKMMNPGDTEMEVCGRSELAVGEYWLSFSSFPDKSKQLAQAFRFSITACQPSSYQESFMYTHCPDVQYMEDSVIKAGGTALLEVFKTLAATCTDTDISRVCLFIEAAQNTPDPAALKVTMEGQGFTFLS